MPKQNQRVEVNAFSKGLITEASPLNIQPDACSEVFNFEFNRNGTISRRLGIDFENNYTEINSQASQAQVTNSGLNTFRWLTVGGNPDLDFLVVQVNQYLHFFNLDFDILSSGYVGDLILSNFPSNVTYSFDFCDGNLVVVGGVDTIAVVSYDADSNTFSTLYDRLLTRDLWGLEVPYGNYETDDSYREEFDPDHKHYYNLQNQSWGIPRKNSTGTLVDPALAYRADIGVVPSNSEQVWPGLQFQAVSSASSQLPFERMYTNLYTEVLGSSVKSAKGYFIIDVLRRGASRLSQFAANKAKYPQLSLDIYNVPNDFTPGGASCIAQYAGRIFYGGFNGQVQNGDSRSPELSNYIFFSQLVRNKKDFAKCYQQGDPTSRDSADVVDTDGGFIRISGAKDVIAMRSLETALIVFASNGVWSVTGGSDYGFSASNYKVTKISTFGAMSDTTIVSEGSMAYSCSEDGIYRVMRNQFGELQADSLTLGTIQTFYQNIPNVSKKNAIGAYDLIDKKVRWIYKTGTLFNIDSQTFELVFDSSLNAFYPNLIQNTSSFNVELVSLFRSNAFRKGSVDQTVLSSTDTVQVNTDNVISTETTTFSGLQSIRYLTLINSSGAVFLTFSQYGNTNFLDWESYDSIGSDAKAYAYAGTIIAGDSAIEKQAPYIIWHMQRTESGLDANLQPMFQSGCKLRVQWDFANKANSNKWSDLMEMYGYRQTYIPQNPSDTYDNGFAITSAKRKIRGRGRALQIYFETEPKKDCKIIGWNLTFNGNQLT